MDFSSLMLRLHIFNPSMDILTKPKTFALLVAILFFLISFLANLLQRRYSKTRLDRILTKEESVVNFLSGIGKNLGELEWTCTIELDGATSPKEVGKAIHVARKKIESTIEDMGKHLRSFRQYRKREKQRIRLEKSHPRPSG
jgi:hypothetical protein